MCIPSIGVNSKGFLDSITSLWFPIDMQLTAWKLASIIRNIAIFHLILHI